MASGVVIEVIWHFAGYLKIFNDIARDRIEYIDPALRNSSDDYTTPRPDHNNNVTPDDVETRGVPMPGPGPLDGFQSLDGLAAELHLGPPLSSPDFFSPRLSPNIPLPIPVTGGGANGGGGTNFHIRVQYKPGGEQSEIDIKQHNILYDNDSLLPANVALPADALTLRLDADTMSTIDRLADDANAHIPTDWWIPQNGTEATDFLTARDAAWADRDGAPDTHSVEPGFYLNGVLEDPAPPPPDQTPPATPEPLPDTGNDLGQWATLGSNSSTNAALIVDATHSARTMVVMGDYYKTDAIFQTNTTVDHDHINVSGGQGAPSIVSGGDVADNIADFVQNPSVWTSIPSYSAGSQWIVNVVDGNYYNVHVVVQTNYLFDNDVIAQTSGDTHYDLIGGDNELGNLTQVFDGSIHYDLIIVLGAYHGMNVIFQNNILLNSDQVRVDADAADPSQSVSSGANSLLNEATIENYGGQDFNPLTDNIKLIEDLLGSGKTSLDPALATAIAGHGGPLNVLYITGDYYDVNAVWQTNVTADINVIYQLQNQPSDAALSYHPDGSVTQSVNTGGDSLVNDAAIIDINPDTTYVDGDIYTDSILVQVNLLPTDQDQAVNADAQALVPELIAFVDDSQDTTNHAPTTVAPAAQADPIGSMLH